MANRRLQKLTIFSIHRTRLASCPGRLRFSRRKVARLYRLSALASRAVPMALLLCLAPAASALQLESCGRELASGRAECGRLSVAENPAAPDEGQISLKILRLPALASSPEEDPLFVLVGGPGEAATDLVERLPPLFRQVNRQRDVVFVDQRGTGASNGLDCETPADADYSLLPEQSLALRREWLRDCLQELNGDLRFYTTPFAMDDLEQVRRALGYARINLWGGSYGTRAALVYMRRHPDSVRSAILDGLAPFALALPQHAAVDASTALARLIAHCERDESCRERFPDLEGRTRELIRRLDAEPQEIEVEHPLSQERLTVTMDGQLFAGLLRLALYQRDLGPILPMAIASASTGDFRPLTLLLVLAEEMSGAISLGMQHTVLCAEDLPQALAEPDPDTGLLQLDLMSEIRAICEFWPQGILPDNYLEPVASELPVLLLSGELDPVTPPRWAEEAARTLPNSRHIRVPGGHHIVSHLGCVGDLILSFLDNPDPAALDAGCAADIQPLAPFVSPAGPAMGADEPQTRDKETADD